MSWRKYYTTQATCYVCKATKPLSQFYKDSTRWNGRCSRCKSCEHDRWEWDEGKKSYDKYRETLPARREYQTIRRRINRRKERERFLDEKEKLERRENELKRNKEIYSIVLAKRQETQQLLERIGA